MQGFGRDCEPIIATLQTMPNKPKPKPKLTAKELRDYVTDCLQGSEHFRQICRASGPRKIGLKPNYNPKGMERFRAIRECCRIYERIVAATDHFCNVAITLHSYELTIIIELTS